MFATIFPPLKGGAEPDPPNFHRISHHLLIVATKMLGKQNIRWLIMGQGVGGICRFE
jgi:hypothetical protein